MIARRQVDPECRPFLTTQCERSTQLFQRSPNDLHSDAGIVRHQKSLWQTHTVITVKQLNVMSDLLRKHLGADWSEIEEIMLSGVRHQFADDKCDLFRIRRRHEDPISNN